MPHPSRNAETRFALVEGNLEGDVWTGYERPEPGGMRTTTHGYGPITAPDVLRRCEEGCVLLDRTPLLGDPNAVRLVIDGPLLDPTLPEGKVDRCPQPSPWLVAGLEGTFRALALRQLVQPSWTGLDSVGIMDYAAYWRRAGARIGMVHAGKPEWDGGEPR